jgi:hypothetical protein
MYKNALWQFLSDLSEHFILDFIPAFRVQEAKKEAKRFHLHVGSLPLIESWTRGIE